MIIKMGDYGFSCGQYDITSNKKASAICSLYKLESFYIANRVQDEEEKKYCFFSKPVDIFPNCMSLKITSVETINGKLSTFVSKTELEK